MNQIGVVLVGKTLPGFGEILLQLKHEILFIVLLALGFGLAPFATATSKQMFWLEPHEIVRMYEERTATFHSMNEGVIAIDNQHHITILMKKRSRYSMSDKRPTAG